MTKKYQLKICGINDLASLEFCLNYHYQPDFLGFIFYPKSPRNIDLNFAKKCNSYNFAKIKKVAVTVNASFAELAEIDKALAPDIIQLHGDEDLAYIKKLRTKFKGKISKALGIATNTDLAKIATYQAEIDYFLFDTKSTNYGGTGQKFDWKILAELNIDQPYFLSGGLNSSNIHNAFQDTQAKYFDLSSGVELQKGIKDTKKIAEILDIFKQKNEA